MKNCPACKANTADDALECSWCGVIFKKWEEHHRPPGEIPPPAEVPPETSSADAPPEALLAPETLPSDPSRLKVAVFAFLGNILLWTLVLYMKPTPSAGPFSRMSEAVDSAESPTGELGTGDEWEREVKLEGSPQGLAWNGEEFLIGNRVTPWGAIRLGLDGKQRKVDVLEPAYNQKIQIPVLTWNGSNYVGYVDGAWFQKNNTYLFTVHDPKTLAVIKTYPAPNLLGGLAWDGTSYWAATRRNTRDSGEPAFLYQLDADFNVVKKLDPPAFGCQGLAWAGSTLWWVDVFTNELYLVRTGGDLAEKILAYDTGMNYLSGIAYDGVNIWISDYQNNKLTRLPTRLVRAWTRGDFRVRNHGLVMVCKGLLAFSNGNEGALNELLEKMGGGTLTQERVHEAAEAMVSLDAKEPLIQAMTLALSRNEHAANHAVIRQELERLTGVPNSTPEPAAETPQSMPAEPTPTPAPRAPGGSGY